ncbi:MAG: spore germination protein GerW family protein [Acutalibacteraceae bacterium]|nr:spore germination protein GerW family protein [Acutalibacteraceae bacterium]
MAEKSAGAILTSTIEKIRELVDTSTIIGEAIYAEGGTTIIPVSKVTYGFASGGADFPSKGTKELFGGGGGAGVTITPVAFLVINGGEVTLKHITAYDNAAERVVNLVPEMFDKVTGLINKTKKDVAPAEDAVDAPIEPQA